MNKARTIIIDGVEIQTNLSAIEIASLPQKNAELQQRIDKAIEYINSESSDAGVSGKRIKEILKGDNNGTTI